MSLLPLLEVDELTLNECMTFSLALISLTFTVCEYIRKRESDKANILLSYNKRFVSDETIQKVIVYAQEIDENRGKPSFDSTSLTAPKQSEFCLFVRFYEELQTAIDANGFNKENICRLYAYYAIEVYNNHKDKIGNVDKDESWFLFRKFCKDMIKEEQKLNITHN